MLLNWHKWQERKISYLIVWLIKVVWDICHGCWCKWSSTKSVDERRSVVGSDFFGPQFIWISLGLNKNLSKRWFSHRLFCNHQQIFCLGWWHFMIACSSSPKARNGAVGIVTRISGWMTPWRRRDCDVAPPSFEGCSTWCLNNYGLQMQIWSQSFALLYDFFSWLGAFGQPFICGYWLVIWTKMDFSWAPSNRPYNGMVLGSLRGLGNPKWFLQFHRPGR